MNRVELEQWVESLKERGASRLTLSESLHPQRHVAGWNITAKSNTTKTAATALATSNHLAGRLHCVIARFALVAYDPTGETVDTRELVLRGGRTGPITDWLLDFVDHLPVEERARFVRGLAARTLERTSPPD